MLLQSFGDMHKVRVAKNLSHPMCTFAAANKATICFISALMLKISILFTVNLVLGFAFFVLLVGNFVV